MKQYFGLVILSIIILFGLVSSTPEEDACKNQSNKDCGPCIRTPNCGYCKSTKVCFLYDRNNLLSAPCATADMQYQTCVGMFFHFFFLSLNELSDMLDD